MVTELHRGKSTISLFTVAAPGVGTIGFGLLARQMSGQHSVYKLQAAAPVILNRPFSPEELHSLAEEYTAAMRAVQPRGPYSLAAMCESVLLAQEMVLLLEDQGQQISLFVILDTWVLENSMVRALWAVDYYWNRLKGFLSMSAQRRWEIEERTIGRILTPNHDQGRSGWGKAYWPGKDFKPPQFRAPVLLFKRPSQPYYYVRDPQMGWGQRSGGGVEICEVDCGHIDFLREPHVRLVAERIASRLASCANLSEAAMEVATSTRRAGWTHASE